MSYKKFKGTYNHGLDAKKRLFIPAKYRGPLGSDLVLCRAPHSLKGIYAYPAETWDELCEELDEKSAQGELSSADDWEVRNLYRYSEDVSMDSQGRITLSNNMCEFAGLKNEVVIIGNMKHLEIWDPETFAEAEAQSEANGKLGTPKINF